MTRPGGRGQRKERDEMKAEKPYMEEFTTKLSFRFDETTVSIGPEGVDVEVSWYDVKLWLETFSEHVHEYGSTRRYETTRDIQEDCARLLCDLPCNVAGGLIEAKDHEAVIEAAVETDRVIAFSYSADRSAAQEILDEGKIKPDALLHAANSEDAHKDLDRAFEVLRALVQAPYYRDRIEEELKGLL
jgi:hypothetical protein